MQKFKRRHIYAEGVQYDGSPRVIEQIKERLPEHAEAVPVVNGNLLIIADGRREVLTPGDFFAYETSGLFTSIPANVFNIIYESV